MDKDAVNVNQEATLDAQEAEAKQAVEGQGDQKEENKGGDKVFTQDEVTAIVEARLARERSKAEKETEKKIESAIQEAERLAKLSEDERKQEAEEAKDKELEATKAEPARVYLERDTMSRLAEEKIPSEFKDFLMGTDAESTNENIKAFKPVFESMIQKQVEERLKGKTPTVAAQASKADVWSTLKDKYKKG